MRNLIMILVLIGVFVAIYFFGFQPDALEGPILKWAFIAVGTLVVAGLMAAITIGYGQSSRMQSWPSVEGTVTRSGSGFVTARFGNDTPTTSRQADIAYDFTVNGTSHQGTRVVQAGAPSEAEMQRLLRDYRVGTKVMVYYDPSDPANAIIERPKAHSPLRYMLLPALIGLGYGLWLYGNPVPDAFLPLLLIAGAFGLFFSWAFWAWWRQYSQVARFAKVEGTVTLARVESFVRHHLEDRKGIVRIEDEVRGEKVYRAVVQYSHQAEGQGYTSRNIRASGEVTGPEEHVKKLIEGYKSGSKVTVWHEPGNPARAMLERPTRAGRALLPLAVGCLALAWAAL